MLLVALLGSALWGASGASCAAGTELSTSSSGPSSTTSSDTSSSTGVSTSGSGGATGSTSGSGDASSSSAGSGGASTSSSAGAGGIGGATSSSSASGGTGGATMDAGPDSGPDAGDGGTPVGVLVMLAGSATTVLAGEYHPGAGWMTTTLADATTDGPAIALTSSTSAIGLIRSTMGGQLRSTDWAPPGSWLPFTALGAAVTAHDTPAIVASGTSAAAAFHGDDFKHYFALHQATWAPVAEPIGGSAAQSFGPTPAAITALGADVVVAYTGMNGDLYDQTRTGGAWLTAHGHGLGNVLTVTPAIIAPTAGPDLMILFRRSTDARIVYTTRTGTTWTAPAPIDVTALTNDPVSLVALPGGRAVTAYKGQDGKLYASRFDPAATPVWSTPAAVFTPNVAIPSTPALAPGLAGADAELVYIDGAGGAAKHTTLTGTTWSPPIVIGGTGLAHAAVSGLAM